MQTFKRIRFSRSAALGLLSGGVLFGFAAVAHGQLQPRVNRLQPHATAAPAVTTAAPATATTTIAATGQTSDQKIRLSQYVDKTNATIKTEVHANGKIVTDDERKAVTEHWRLSTRLLRCRDVASDVGDQASIAEVDADLATLDTKFDAQLKALNAKAPK
ncbi:MAG: hypothetical protein ACRELY_09205 [Polyangiaceae bacterium]